MNLHFEKAKEEDIGLLFSLNKDLIDCYEDTGAIEYEKVLQWVHSNISQNIAHFSRVNWNGKTVGFFCLQRLQKQWELDSLFILPPYRNEGIGTAVLEHCLKKAEYNLFFYVFRANIQAIRLYQRVGFTITKEVEKTRYIMEYQKGC